MRRVWIPLAWLAAGCGPLPEGERQPVSEPPKVAWDSLVLSPSGLLVQDIEPGTGDPPPAGSKVTLHYDAWLEDGTPFDSSRVRNAPYVFTLGRDRAIPAWEESIATMRIGGRRRLVVPPELGYGPEGVRGVPAGARVVFEIELLGFE